ncbi:MAG: 2-hydroxyacid dehydrogenase [Acetobacteraceae bacterium]|nr:2-hydroxyacid dehydrogenase [Acetobacteraceae bacterium]MDW8397100.1 2-hydroxyacid dehydrogenase [Acetobacteraceae bacterium]
MDVTVYSTRPYDRAFLAAANDRAGAPHRFLWLEARLSPETASLATPEGAVCLFVNDIADAPAIAALAARRVRLIALRASGFNSVDLSAARTAGIRVARVPAYSPEAVAEHTAGMVLSLARHLHRAFVRVREGNFALDGLLGITLAGRSVGVVGTGRIGLAFARIMRGFGCRLLAHDPAPSAEAEALGVRYVSLTELLAGSDIVSLHCPLTPQTHHMIDAAAIARMKPGVMLINTGRGALVDTAAVIEGLKSGRIGHLGLDVYEEEADLFFADLSNTVIRDDVFARLLTLPNVLITGHQAFFTEEALTAIAETTIANLSAFEAQGAPLHEVAAE